MKSFGKIQRLAWYEIGRNKMKTVLSVIGIGIAYLLILLPIYATEYDENGIAVYAVLIAIITLIGTKSAYGMFRDLYFAPEDNSLENSATPQERYLSKVWVVIYIHLIPAIAIGLIGIVIASIVDDSLWAAKYMLLVTPIMACVMMAVDAIMVICAVYSAIKSIYLANKSSGKSNNAAGKRISESSNSSSIYSSTYSSKLSSNFQVGIYFPRILSR